MRVKKKALSFILMLAMLMTSMFTGVIPVSAVEAFPQEGTMVINGGFETDAENDGVPDSWLLNVPSGTNASISLEKGASAVYAGSASLKFISPAKTNDIQVTVTESEFHSVNSSKSYIIEFYAKVPSGVIHLFVDEKMSEGSSPVRKDMWVDAHQWQHSQWTKFTTEYTPTEGMGFARIEFYNWNELALEGYIDNVVFREKSDIPSLSFNQQDGTKIYGTDQQLFTISGTVSDDYNNLNSLTINGATTVPVSNGQFSVDMPLNIGANVFTLTAKDNSNLTVTESLTIILEVGTSPVINLYAGIKNYTVVNEPSFTLSGTVTDSDLIGLEINGENVVLTDVEGSIKSFSKDISLKIGYNKLTAIARDQIGLTAQKELWIRYIPESSKSDYDIGVFYFSNWNPDFFPGMMSNNKAVYGPDSDWFGGIREHLLNPGPWGYGPIADREPLLGWYDDRQQAVLDSHILQAASRGIDHFAFYYYWKEGGGGPRPGQNVDKFKTSPYRDLMSYYLYFVADGAYGINAWENSIVPKLIEYMKEPYYKRTAEGRPILGLYGDMEGRLGGTALSLKTELDFLRNKCIEAGLENPLLLYDGYRTLDAFIAQGYDGFLPLNLAGIGLDDNKGTPEDYASSYPDAWKDFVYADYSTRPEYQNYENYLFIPGALNAYDVRPWEAVSGSPVDKYMYADPSPSKFGVELGNVKAYLDSHSRSMNMATFYAWNEWGEGGSIEPNTLFGYGYIDTMQEVFGLKNNNYKMTAEVDGLSDIAPDVRVSIEPEYAVVTEGQNVKLKVRIKNYSNMNVAGTLSLNTNGWTLAASTGTNFALNVGESADAEYNITAGAGDYWIKHYFEVTVDYGGNPQSVSTFVVKAAPFYACLEKDISKNYKDCRFDIKLKARNYTMSPKTVNYALELPEGWTADIPAGNLILEGYSGAGVHTGRTAASTVVISYPELTEAGKYTIKLITTDGEFTKAENFTVDIVELSNLLYNGSFELDDNNDGMPDVWSPGWSGGNIAMVAGTEESPAPKGIKYVKVNTTIPVDDADGYVEMGIKQEGTKVDANWLIIDPAKKYELSFWAKVEKGGIRASDTEVSGIYYEGLGAYNSSKLITAEDNGNTWKHYSFTFFPNPHAGRESVRFYGESKPGDEVTFYLDAVILREVELTPEENMIVNGGMESDNNGDGVADGWITQKTGGSLSFSYDWQDQYGGIRSQKISGTNADGSCFKQEWFDVNPSKQYIVEFWAKVTSGEFTVVSEEKVGDGGTPSLNSGLDFSANTWQKYTYIFKPQGGMTKSSLRFAIKGSGTSTAWIDNVVMKPDTVSLGAAPVITLDQVDGAIADKRKFTVSGSVTDADGDLNFITVNGDQVVSNNGKFEVVVKLDKDINTIVVAAMDTAGNMTEKIISVTYKEAKK